MLILTKSPHDNIHNPITIFPPTFSKNILKIPIIILMLMEIDMNGRDLCLVLELSEYGSETGIVDVFYV